MKNITMQIVIAVLSILVSCKPEAIDVVIPQSEPGPVISSQYLSGGLLAVTLTKSFSSVTNPRISYDSNGIQIDKSLLYENAEVWLYGGNGSQKMQWVDNSFYVLENNLLEDYGNYRLEVKVNGSVIASATEMKVPMIRFDSVTAFRIPDNNKNINVFYRVKNLKPGQVYFVVNYFTKKTQDTIPAQPDPEYIAKRMLEQNTGFDLFTSSDFRNGEYLVSKTVATGYETDTLMLGISCITEGYFRFLTAQKKAGSLFNQLRGEVINFPSNIKNGYGYFSLAESDIRILECIK